MELLIVIVLCLCTIAICFFLTRKKGTATIVSQPEETVEEAKPQVTEEKPVPEETKEDEPEVEEEPTAVAEEEHSVLAEGNQKNAVEDEQKVVAEEEPLDKGVTQNKQLIASLHKVLEEDKVFLRPDIHIDDVARMLLTNRTYVTRLMRQEYGLSFIEYVNIARIQHSQNLLYSSDMTLDEVSMKSGFQSTSNYCRAFKRYIGDSPLTWLQKVKG